MTIASSQRSCKASVEISALIQLCTRVIFSNIENVDILPMSPPSIMRVAAGAKERLAQKRDRRERDTYGKRAAQVAM